jgi:hypothetical protein
MEEMMVCKDCDHQTSIEPGPDLIKAGWDWIDLVEGDNICNGWRCPECVEGWRIIVEEAPHGEFALN